MTTAFPRRLSPLRRRLCLLVLCLGAALVPGTVRAGGFTIHRIALIAGASDGGPQRERLRFADADADSVARVLSELGGVRSEERLLVPNANRARLREGFLRTGALVRAAARPDARIEVLFYYSGHSDEEGLLASGERVGYDELRRWIDETGADVRIAILDSCASGALTRTKGGLRRAPFLIDSSSKARGHAFLTASSADEAAQESDRIGAAFFTHYLVSGLRGAADSSRDGRVTLQEAYQYAFHETLARTEKTRVGPQHPTYDIQLAGTGDLVMTDLRAASATLVIDAEVQGRVFVRDADGHLAAELRKTTPYPVELGLEPGRYRITVEREPSVSEGQVELRAGARTQLASAQLAPAVLIATRTRGDSPAGDGPPETVVVGAAAAAGPPLYRTVPVNVSLAPGMDLNGPTGPQSRVINNFGVGLVTSADVLHGAQLSLAANLVNENVRGAQFAVGLNMVGGSLRGLQMASGVNLVRGDATGAQFALIDVALGHVSGVQSSGVATVARGGLEGVQLSGAVNFAGGESHGAQLAPVNIAGTLSGVQLAVVNVGGTISGTQVGVVNVARSVHGLQLGVINVADDADATVGLINVVRHGYNHVEAWTSDTVTSGLSLVWGGRRVYGVVGLAGQSDEYYRVRPTQGLGGDQWRLGLGFGLGLHTDLNPRWFVDADLTSWSFDDVSGNINSQFETLRVLIGWRATPLIAPFAALCGNVTVSWDGEDVAFGPGVGEVVAHRGTGSVVRLAPGLAVGLRI